MLFIVFCITAFAAVTGDLLEVAYDVDENYFDTFSSIQCVNTTQWKLVGYGRLEVVPPYEGSTLAIKALNNSCSTSFPIVFFKGTLELTVYLRTISKFSGVTASVFDEQGEPVLAVRYQKINRNFVPGWVVVSVPIEKHTTGYVQLSGQSLINELVLVDSFRYIPDSSAHIQSEEKSKTVTNRENKNIFTSFAPEDIIVVDKFVFEFDENGSGDEDLEGSGETEEQGVGTESPPDNNTENPGTEDPGTENPGTENPGTENPGTENPGTEDPGTENPGTENPGTENPGTENPSSENPGTENPGTENPGTEDPGTENPGTEYPVTENPGTENPGTENPGTENPGSENPGTENPGTGNPGSENPGTEDPINSTELESVEDSTEEQGSEDAENSEDGFWNVFTITLVAVGSFTAVGVLGVGSYYLGKNRALSQNPPMDWEALEPPSEPPIRVPRARSVFSDTTYDRFSRDS